MFCSKTVGNLKMRDFDRAARGRGGADAVITVTGGDINLYNENNRVVAAVLSAALYPNIVKVLTPEAKYVQTATGRFPCHFYFMSSLR